MRLRDKLQRAEEKRIEQRSKCLFQIEENDGSLWLTFDGNLICPTTMLNGDALSVLKEIRQLYIKHNSKP